MLKIYLLLNGICWLGLLAYITIKLLLIGIEKGIKIIKDETH